MKSIRSKIALILLTIIVFLSLSFGVINSILNVKTSGSILKQAMIETAGVTADRIYQELEGYTGRVYDVGSTALLADDAVLADQKKVLLSQRAAVYGFQQGNVVNRSGMGLDGKSYADQAFVKEAMAGNTYLSFLGQNPGAVVISAPLWENGAPGTTVKGVVYFVTQETFLSEIAADVTLGETGLAYLVDKSGTIIAHPQASAIGSKSTGEQGKIEAEMATGTAGYNTFDANGTSKIMGYAPIPGANGWSVAIMADRSEFMAAGLDAILWIVLISVLFCVVGVFVSFRVGRTIAKPISLCANRLYALSEGDLSTPVPVIHTKDETGMLANATGVIVGNMQAIIGDMVPVLEEIARSNFNVGTRARDAYRGDFQPIAEHLEHIIVSLNNTLSQINRSANMVSSEAEQVSYGAQQLAQGASEQTASIEELAAAIHQISEKIKENAINAREASEWADQTVEEVGQCNEQMQKMVAAMERIEQSSAQISNIVKTIEDIAFQTNILALNAAVEASRAGTAGRGFAVVADEVRSLASKSAASAKNTSDLIAGSLAAVAEGAKMADSTLKALQAVTKSIAETQREHREIAQVNEEQSEAVDQVGTVMDQISAVVQTNSATAEESAAASEELSGQAQLMKSLVGQFTLRSDKPESNHDVK